jgi:coproporphyrinogen III oxidase
VREAMQAMVFEQQAQLCEALERLDGGARFRQDGWQREQGGGGKSCVLENGRVFEKVGVNVSVVHGELSEQAAQQMGGGSHLGADAPRAFFATGLSLIAHPHNPMCPTVHCNYRYFERGSAEAPAAWWFGGGADLTPSYLFEEDARHFHGQLKAACDAHDPAFYPAFKAWCDRYFFIPHRHETRGVGGIFFDNLCDREPELLLAFVRQCAAAMLPAYAPIVLRRAGLPFGERERAWQQLRRGRYVEFNLVYDRGTTFGLKTGGRIESILVSLPLTARWQYDPPPPAPGSPEAALLAALREPRAWA